MRFAFGIILGVFLVQFIWAQLSSSNTKSVYSITYQSVSIDLPRGQVVTLPVQVLPGDLPGSFSLVTADSRLNVTGSGNGINRSISIHDLTSAGDSTPLSPDNLSINMVLPDGKQGVSPTGQPVLATVNLKKTFQEYTQEALNTVGSSIQNAIDGIPTACSNGIGSGLAAGIQNLAANQQPPQTLTASQIAAAKSIGSQLGSNSGFCNALGDAVGSNTSVQVQNMDPTFAAALVGRAEVPPTPNTNLTLTFVYAGISVNTNGGVALQYSPGDFVNTSGPWSLTYAPIVTKAQIPQINVSARTASFSAEFDSSYTINYNDGTFSFSDTNQLTLQFSWQFGGP